MRKSATLNSQNKLARHRLQVELWRQRQRKHMGDSADGGDRDDKARQTMREAYEDHPEVIE
ncbi:hypothetical protein Bhz55_00038 [Stenotrophomonas phage vB_SmaS_Bhz55]